MSRIVSVCLCAVVAFVATFGVSLLRPAPALAATGTLTMETPLQQAPDPSAPVIALMPEGTVVSIDGPPVDGFYPVTAGNVSGWMRGETMQLEKDIVDDGSIPAATPDEAGQMAPLEQETSDEAAPVDPSAPPAADSDVGLPATDPTAEPTSSEPAAETDDASASDAVAPDPAAVDLAAAETAVPEATEADPTAADTAPPDAAPVDATAAPSENAAPIPTADPNVTPIPVAEDVPTGSASATVDVAIRVGPSRDYDVITTAPAGSTVEQTGHLVDGYVSVQYNDITGWARTDQLDAPGAVVAAPTPTDVPATEPAGGPRSTDGSDVEATSTATPEADTLSAETTPEPSATPAPTPEPAPNGPASSLVDMPIMDGPGPGYGLIFTVPQGSAVQQTGQLVDGYVSVQYKEVSGWSALEQLGPPIENVDENIPADDKEPVETKTPRPGSGVAYTTVDLSLRAGPSADEEPIVVVPAGSRLVLTGVMEGDFQRVTYGDNVGWVSNDYLTNPEDPAPNGDGKGKQENYGERQIVHIIYQAADHYGQDRNDMLRVARCESNLDPYAVNPSGSYGLFQFIRSTWKSTPYGDKDIFDPSANANAAAWMWKQGRKSEWVCQ
jgi:uncharacterized protein YraI